MPSVYKYKPSSPKSGYYLKTRIDGNYINIQTTRLSNKIFRMLALQHGDDISHYLLWKMYEANLLYTENSGVSQDTDQYIIDEQRGGYIQLTAKQRQALANAMERYSDSTEIAELKQLLRGDIALPEASTDKGQYSSLGGGRESPKEFHEDWVRELLDEDESDGGQSQKEAVVRTIEAADIEATIRGDFDWQYWEDLLQSLQWVGDLEFIPKSATFFGANRDDQYSPPANREGIIQYLFKEKDPIPSSSREAKVERLIWTLQDIRWIDDGALNPIEFEFLFIFVYDEDEAVILEATVADGVLVYFAPAEAHRWPWLNSDHACAEEWDEPADARLEQIMRMTSYAHSLIEAVCASNGGKSKS